eukprot:s2121_g11.t1
MLCFGGSANRRCSFLGCYVSRNQRRKRREMRPQIATIPLIYPALALGISRTLNAAIAKGDDYVIAPAEEPAGCGSRGRLFVSSSADPWRRWRPGPVFVSGRGEDSQGQEWFVLAAKATSAAEPLHGKSLP